MMEVELGEAWILHKHCKVMSSFSLYPRLNKTFCISFCFTYQPKEEDIDLL